MIPHFVQRLSLQFLMIQISTPLRSVTTDSDQSSFTIAISYFVKTTTLVSCVKNQKSTVRGMRAFEFFCEATEISHTWACSSFFFRYFNIQNVQNLAPLACVSTIDFRLSPYKRRFTPCVAFLCQLYVRSEQKWSLFIA